MRRCWKRTWRSPTSRSILIGQARELYTYAAKAEGKDNNEDKLAYLRDVRQYRNLLLVEQPNGDFRPDPGAAVLLFAPSPTSIGAR
jgi:hypothetical protein